MKLTTQTLYELLQDSDIEGFIELGAPDDEYNSEAQSLSLALAELDSEELTEKNIEMISQDLVTALKKSVLMIDENILDPKSFPNTKKNEKGGVRIKKNSLRGNSLFVQMAKCEINSMNDFNILEL